MLHGGGDHRAPGRRVLQPGDPVFQRGKVAAKAFVAQPQETQLRVGAPVSTVIKIGRGLLNGRGQIEKTVGGNVPAKLVQRGAVKPAGQQRRAALRGGFPQQQVTGQGGKLTQYSAYILAPGVQLVQQQ